MEPPPSRSLGGQVQRSLQLSRRVSGAISRHRHSPTLTRSRAHARSRGPSLRPCCLAWPSSVLRPPPTPSEQKPTSPCGLYGSRLRRRLDCHRAREGLSSFTSSLVHIPLPLRREVLRRCTSKLFTPSMAFARTGRGSAPPCPSRAGVRMTTRQDSLLIRCGLRTRRPRSGRCRGASPVGSPLAAAANYQGGLVPPCAGPAPAGYSRLHWTHTRFRGHLKIGAVQALMRSPHAENTTALPA